ncbi:MAG TPA: hypothetical protein PLO37_14595 [Candidatus Hydrogenedentes bacterium]|nr:hypothetical protein [Candidatus Hydrogenedentota bacterium]HPG68076.1 hypothetical protein [Candidatus Hydrogenedentota bacterium]
MGKFVAATRRAKLGVWAVVVLVLLGIGAGTAIATIHDSGSKAKAEARDVAEVPALTSTVTTELQVSSLGLVGSTGGAGGAAGGGGGGAFGGGGGATIKVAQY